MTIVDSLMERCGKCDVLIYVVPNKFHLVSLNKAILYEMVQRRNEHLVKCMETHGD